MTVDVAIVGAGPYGLSIASHLRAHRLDLRVFGRPMETWRTHMPAGMFLKSEGFASSLYDPARDYTLAAHCASRGIAYAEAGLPVPLQVFSDYGLAFQQRQVPELEPQDVTGVAPGPAGFRVTLADGETFDARKVVLAVGITHFAHTPAQLSHLPAEVCTHSSQHHDLSGFAGREVIVVGAGASAIDCAALLCKNGASVQLVSRTPEVRFHAAPSQKPRPLIDRIRAPQSGLGPGWRSRLCTDAPLLFHAMPLWFRLEVVKRHLGPAASWWTKAMLEGRAVFHLGQSLQGATLEGGRVRLDVAGPDGTRRSVSADHVIAATGYHPLLSRLAFLDAGLQARIRTAMDAPVLSMNFESSVPGLYFSGLASANNFGPVTRFAFGAGFTAQRVSRHVARAVRRSPSLKPQAGAAQAGSTKAGLSLADAA